MWSERKQEIAKAKLKKVRQQLNVQANPQQVQVGGGATVTAPAQAMVAPAGPTAVHTTTGYCTAKSTSGETGQDSKA